MGLEASEIAVRVRLLGGSAYEKEAAGVAKATEGIGAAAKRTDATLAATGIFGAGSFGKKLESVGGKVKALGRSLAPLSLGIAAIGVYSSKAATQFQASMMRLVTNANMPISKLKGLTLQVQSLAAALGQKPTALAEALYPIVSTLTSGKIRGNPVDMLVAAAKGAGIGGDTSVATANALTSVMASGIAGGATPKKIMALLDAAVGQGKMHMADITAAMNSGILPIAKKVGIPINQLLASAAAETKQGVDATTAFNRLRFTLTSVGSPTAMAQKAMAAMGFTNPLQLAADMKRSGIVGMLSDLQSHASRLPGGANGLTANALIADIFGKSRGIASIGTLLDSLGDLSAISQNVLKFSTPQVWEKHWKQYQSTAEYKKLQLAAAGQNAAISFGTVINKDVLPALASLTPILNKFATWFDKLPGPVKKFTVFFLAFIAISAPLLILVGSVITSIGIISGALGTLAGVEGFGALAAGVTMTVSSFALLVPAIAALIFFLETKTGKKITHGIEHAGFKTGSFLGDSIAKGLVAMGFSHADDYYSVQRYLNSPAFKHLSPLVQGDIHALYNLKPNTPGPMLGQIERDLKAAGITNVNNVPGITSAMKQAVKEGIKEARVNVFLPNGKEIARTVNEENRRSQNRR